jgi:hypothetical protein
VWRFFAVVLGVVALLLGSPVINGKSSANRVRLAKAAPQAVVSLSAASFESAGNLVAQFDGDGAALQTISSGQIQPLSLASEDLNGDGVADLIVGYAASGKGVLSIYFGNHEAFVQGIAAHSSNAFLPKACVLALPEPPDFLVTGDFNHDGFLDLLVGARGSHQIYLLAGDGAGNFSSLQAVQLPGSLTAMVAGQIGLRDTLADVAVGVNRPNGPAAVIFKGSLGGLTNQSLVFPLSASPNSIAIGDLDGDSYADLAIITQGNISILHGRDWKTDIAAGVFSPLASLETLSLPFSAKTLALGSFVFERNGKTQMAVLDNNGAVHVIARGQLDSTPVTATEIQAMRLAKFQSEQAALKNGVTSSATSAAAWQPSSSEAWNVAQTLSAPMSSSSSSAGLIAMEIHDGGPGHGVLLLDSSSSQLHLLSGPGVSSIQTQNQLASGASSAAQTSSSAAAWSDVAITTNNAPVAALPMRISGFARSGLVTLHSGQVAPSIIVPAGDPVLTVNRKDDISPRGTGVTCITPASTDCSLREAIIKANATPGTYTIQFAASTDTTSAPAGPIQLTIPGSDNASAVGDLDINTNITIAGNGPTNTIIQGNFPVADNVDEKIFGVNQDGTHTNLSVTIDNVTVEGGRNSVLNNDPTFEQTGGGIDFFLTGTTVSYTLSNCVVTNNTNVHSYGGGVNVDSASPPSGSHGTVTITNCTISNNQTLGTVGSSGGETSQGGGINLFADIHNVTISNSTISSNSVAAGGEGGGLYVRHTNGGNIGIHNSTITGNSATARGGGIRINGLVQTVTIDQSSVISNNVSGSSGNTGEGGGIYVANGGSASTSISQVTITNNSLSAAATQRGGGGIAQGGGYATVQFSRFFGNTASGSTGRGFHKDLNTGTATITDNWWGCNPGPSASPCDTAAIDAGTGTMTFAPWLVLSNTPSPATILTSQTSTITASFQQDNLGATVSGSNLGSLVGVPITFNNAVLGTLSGAATSIQSGGTATATFTAGGVAGTGHVDATVDSATVTANITINPGPATHFTVSTPASATAGSAFSFTVTALDANNNVASGYSGTVHFTSTDGAATLPADSTLTNGVGTFSATLKTAGARTITATDTVTGSITGTSNTITVSPAAATHFTVSAPATASGNVAFSFTVTALDQFNNTATGYAGTVHFSSTDGTATLPANSTLTNGVGTFSATLRTPGSQTITATDTVTGSITGTSSTITVTILPATHFAVSAPASATAGTAFSFTVTALDMNNNPTSAYSGTVHFTSSDGAATLPANSTLTNGVGTFSATLKTAGNQTITATDTVTSSITATSNTITVSAAAATHFTVSAPASATAGTAFSLTLTALDQFNNTATGYTGTVHFTSSDATATLPANSTLTNGVGTFSTTLKTAGSQTVTAIDTVTASITGTSNAITVSPAVATHFAVSAPASATAGTAFSFTVTAQDQFNNTATGYTGTVHFTSSDAAGTLPANSTLTNGIGTFSATLKAAGNQTLTATDTVTGTITGTSGTITVSPGAATHFIITAPASATAGTAFSFTVTAADQFNNTATGYAGIVHLTSGDATATLPANSTLTSGVGTFSATLKTAGGQSITATDTVTTSVTGTSNAITVSPAAATHFTVSAPATATGSVAFSFTVTAQDQFNNTATAYAGTVHFTSSDAAGTLPANSTLTNGVGTFSATLKTAGSQTITATDTITASVTGTSNTITATVLPATHFTVSAPASATAGTAFSFTVTALDVNNNTALNYAGTVHFTSTDGTATLPANSTLTNGIGTFSATLKTAGNQTITATDSVTSSITGVSGTVVVSPAAATHFTVSAPATATGNTAFSFTVTAQDQFNNTTTGYTGTVHFTSSDGAGVLPANSTLTNGVGTFSATLKTAGNQTITATDTVTVSITGTSNTIAVTVLPATHFTVSAPASATAGTAFSFTVTALDVNNSTVTNYAGTVHFTSSDGVAVLPANSTLTNGVGTFSATLKTAGNQTIAATDTVTASITGTSNTIAVSAGAATHFAVSAPATATGNTAFSFTVTALDQFNNTVTGYAGAVHFTSSDGAAVLPANSTLTNGVGTFSATLKTAGNQTITATDAVNALITGTSNTIMVTVLPATHFTVSAPATATAGSAISFTVTALDTNNSPTSNYTGTVHFTSSDGAATLPVNSTLTNGVGTFSATLKTAGNQTITAADTVTASIAGIGTIVVSPAAASHFAVSVPNTAIAGSTFSFTVTAFDPFNNTATGYAGTVHFTSSDGAATLPANSTLTNGLGTFLVTLKTSGNQTITATDTVNASITGTSSTIAVTQPSDLSITKTHSGNFFQGQTGATYNLTVSNVGSNATVGMVTVADILPQGLTATAISGTGWNCNLGAVTCTRSDALVAGTSYPVVAVTVSVASNAAASVTNAATVSGGGELNLANDTATDITTITAPPDFAISFALATITVKAGQVANYTLTVTPQNNSFTNPVSFSAAGLPSKTSFVFTPTSVTPGASPATSTLAISTTAGDPFLAHNSEKSHAPLYALLLPFMGIVLSGFRQRRSKKGIAGWMVLVILLTCSVIGLPGCAGPSKNFQNLGTPPGTYMITVTASSGTVQHSAPVTLIVQP